KIWIPFHRLPLLQVTRNRLRRLAFLIFKKSKKLSTRALENDLSILGMNSACQKPVQFRIVFRTTYFDIFQGCVVRGSFFGLNKRFFLMRTGPVVNSHAASTALGGAEKLQKPKGLEMISFEYSHPFRGFYLSASIQSPGVHL